MAELSTIKDVIASNMCVGCGLCSIDQLTNGTRFHVKSDCFTAQNQDLPKDSIAHKICPGKGYAIKSMGDALYGNEATYDIDLGFFIGHYAVRSVDEKVLANASSGGAITAILSYLLDRRIVDKVSVTQFECSEDGVSTKTFLTSDYQEIIKAQGSKYCPVDLSGLLKELKEFDGRVAIMATPCAIAGIRNIQRTAPEIIKSNIVLCIANFCGGHKSYKNINRLAEILKVDFKDLKDFRFRGGGQPGSLQFIEKSGKSVKVPYPLYVGLNGYSKMLRCHLCVDATGELADISCGDAWIPRFEKDHCAWSMVICRNAFSRQLLENMKTEGILVFEDVTTEEVKQTQRLNITSKKRRQYARRKLYRQFFYRLPDLYNQGYDLSCSSVQTELVVYIKHKLKYMAESLGLYMKLYGYKKLKR